MKSVVGSLLLVLAVGLPAAGQPHPDDEPGVLTVWESGGLTDSTLAAVELTAAVRGAEVAIVHTGAMRLMGVSRAGADVQRPDEGFGFPMAVKAVASDDAHLVAEGLSEPLERGVVMSQRSAALRGARTGDILELEGWGREIVEVPIAAVLPDHQIGWYEIIMSASTAELLEFERPASALIHGTDVQLAADVFEGLRPEGAPLRVGIPGEPITFTDPTLPTVRIKERFGEFSYRPTGIGDGIEIERSWLDENIVDVFIPALGPFKCHRAVVPYIRGALGELERNGLIEAIDYSDFQIAGGCFNSRHMRGGNKGFALSRHAWGIAIDFNPSTNRYGQPVTLDPEVGDTMRRWGFSWGATWTVPDGMHFEWTHIPDVELSCSYVRMVQPVAQQAPWRVESPAGLCGEADV